MDKKVKCPRCGAINHITNPSLQDCQGNGCSQDLRGLPPYVPDANGQGRQQDAETAAHEQPRDSGHREQPASPFKLRWSWGAETPLRDRLVVGRDMTGDESLRAYLENHHLNVSRQHAAFEVRGSAVFVEDLKSLNGTYVDDCRVRVGEPTQLKPGDKVALGRDPAAVAEITPG